jgi:hypothetical protein
MKFDISALYEDVTRMWGTFHEERCALVIISRSLLLRMRNVADISCRENQNTHFVFSKFSESRDFYDKMWKNMLMLDWPQMAI